MAPLIAAALLVAAAPANAQQNPGVFVHAADDEPTTLDPAQVEPGEGGETVILQVYERLLEFAPTGPELIPALATEVPTLENGLIRSEEHTSELQSLMRISYAVFCLKKKRQQNSTETVH